jgi:type III secretory pathway component EscU
MPRLSVREWLHHTSQMLIFDWFPLTYFTMASILAPRDNLGCHRYAQDAVQDLLFYVYGPVLLLRFLGTLFMNKSHLIIWQIIIIYTYLAIALLIWDLSAIDGMKHLSHHCFKPLHMSMLNLILMTLFYMFVLCPYITTALMLPYAAY